MRLSRLNISIAFFLMNTICYAQVDTLQQNGLGSAYQKFREKSSSILVGVHLQITKDQSGNDYKRKYLEVGLHKTTLTNYAVFTHGFSVEVSPEKRTNVGLKYGGWTNLAFFSLGLSGIYYTNFTHGSLIVRPEFGLGVDRFRFAIGFNVSTISNKSLGELNEAKVQCVLNVLLRRKLIKQD